MSLGQSLFDAATDGTYTSTDTPTRLAIAGLCFAKQPKKALELGGCEGGTSQWLARLLLHCGGALTVVENDVNRVQALTKRMTQFPNVIVSALDSLTFLQMSATDSYDFIYVDDDHTEEHIRQAIPELRRISRNGALVCFHDVEPPSGYIGRLCLEAGGYLLGIGDHGLGLWQVAK